MHLLSLVYRELWASVNSLTFCQSIPNSLRFIRHRTALIYQLHFQLMSFQTLCHMLGEWNSTGGRWRLSYICWSVSAQMGQLLAVTEWLAFNISFHNHLNYSHKDEDDHLFYILLLNFNIFFVFSLNFTTWLAWPQLGPQPKNYLSFIYHVQQNRFPCLASLRLWMGLLERPVKRKPPVR